MPYAYNFDPTPSQKKQLLLNLHLIKNLPVLDSVISHSVS